MTSTSTDVIQRYYSLCSIGGSQRSHIIDQVRDELVGVINKKELEVYFRIQDGMFVPNEVVIGGDEPAPATEPASGGRGHSHPHSHVCIIIC
jgi:hypothetical protein